MKYLLLVLFIFFAPVAAAANETPDYSSEGFLQGINSAVSYMQVKDILEGYSSCVGMDLSEYNELTESDKATVLRGLTGNGYLTFFDFTQAFENAISNYTQSKSGNSGGGSGGSGVIYFPPDSAKLYNCCISGTISLPEGEFAPQGGFKVDLTIEGNVHDSIVIPEGSGGTEYSGEYQVWTTRDSFIIRFILMGDDCAKYQTCTNSLLYFLTNENSTLTADIEIPYAQHRISGVLRLAEDVEALNDDLQLDIYISNTETMFSIYKTLTAGRREVEFLVGVSAYEYTMVCYAHTYGISAFQHISEESETLNIDIRESDITDVVLPIISQNYIEGYVYLPDGETAPEGGLSVNVGRTVAEIPYGESQAYYRTGMYYNSYLFCSVLSENYFGTQFSGGYYTTEGILSIRHHNAADFCSLSENLNIDITLRKKQWIEGVISLGETLDCGATLSINIYADRYGYNDYLYIDAGATTIPYIIEIEEDLNSHYYIHWWMNSDSPKYLQSSGEAKFNVEESCNQYNINVSVIRAALLFSGSISLPEDEIAAEHIIVRLCFESENYAHQNNLIINAGENCTEYEIYGTAADMSDFSGEYILCANIPCLTSEPLYYNGDSFSFEPPVAIALENETVFQRLVLPHPNRVITGKFIMPLPASGKMEVLIDIYSDCRNIITKTISLPDGVQSFDYEIKLFIPDEHIDYAMRYYIWNSDNDTYYSGLDLYLSEDGYTLLPCESKIIDLHGQTQPFEQDIDLGGLAVSGYIGGDFILPNSCVIPVGKYFEYAVHAANYLHTQSKYFWINPGESRTEYKMAVPQVYKDCEWIFWYSVGNVIPEPNKPAVPISPGMPGGGSGGGIYQNSIIPENLHQGYNLYLAQNGGLSFFKEDARKFTFSEGEVENIDIYALDINTPAPRIIGGFFTSAVEIPEQGVNVSVILQSISSEEKFTQSFTFTGEAVKYKFATYGEGEYILQYIIDGETYYYQDSCKLTEDKAFAALIATAGIAAQYKDVYYKNIYPLSYYAKYLSVRRIATPVINSVIKIQIYSDNGVLISEGVSHYDNSSIRLPVLPIVIGYDAGGYKAYFTEYSHNNYVSGHTTDFDMAARIYPTAQKYPNAVVEVNIPAIGFAKGIGTNAKIETSYFDYYNPSENTVYLSRFYISASNTEEIENENIFIACYEKSGKLKFVKTFRIIEGENAIDLGCTIDKSDSIKLIALGGNMNPLFERLYFFGE